MKQVDQIHFSRLFEAFCFGLVFPSTEEGPKHFFFGSIEIEFIPIFSV